MENHESINISMESINNLIFESLRHVRDQKKESIYQQSLHIYIKKRWIDYNRPNNVPY